MKKLCTILLTTAFLLPQAVGAEESDKNANDYYGASMNYSQNDYRSAPVYKPSGRKKSYTYPENTNWVNNYEYSNNNWMTLNRGQ